MVLHLFFIFISIANNVNIWKTEQFSYVQAVIRRRSLEQQFDSPSQIRRPQYNIWKRCTTLFRWTWKQNHDHFSRHYRNQISFSTYCARPLDEKLALQLDISAQHFAAFQLNVNRKDFTEFYFYEQAMTSKCYELCIMFIGALHCQCMFSFVQIFGFAMSVHGICEPQSMPSVILQYRNF